MKGTVQLRLPGDVGVTNRLLRMIPWMFPGLELVPEQFSAYFQDQDTGIWLSHMLQDIPDDCWAILMY